MKRTTYIMIGVLLAGLVVMSGIMIYISTKGTTWDDSFMEIGGKEKTVQLPACKTVQLLMKDDRPITFHESILLVQSTDAPVGNFMYGDGMDSYLSMKTEGDTLKIIFDIAEDKLEKKFQDMRWLKIRAAKMRLSIPADVKQVLELIPGLQTTFDGLTRDSLSFYVNDLAKVENCRITALKAGARVVEFNSGEVKNLYLNLDTVFDWKVNIASFYIDTEHLRGSGSHRTTLQTGECRQLFWTPMNEDASLDVKVNQAARIEVNK